MWCIKVYGNIDIPVRNIAADRRQIGQTTHICCKKNGKFRILLSQAEMVTSLLKRVTILSTGLGLLSITDRYLKVHAEI